MNLFLSNRAAAAFVVAAVLAAMPAAAEPVFPAGVHTGLTPPPGMVPSAAFPGFEDRDRNAAIVISELPPEAYPEIEKAFAVDALKAQGIEAERREEIANARGFIVVARQQAGGAVLHKWALVATTSTATVLITMQVPDAAADAYPEALCRETLTSFIVRPNIPDDEQLALLPYRVREFAGFRLLRTLRDGTTLLTEGPNDTVGANDQPLMLITIPPGEVPQPADRAGFARRLLAATPGLKEIRIMRSEPMRIGGQPGYEVIAEAKNAATGAEMSLVQWIRFGQGRYMHIYGLGPRDGWGPMFTRMRAVRDGIEPK